MDSSGASSGAGRLAPHPTLVQHYPRPEDRQSYVTELFDRTATHYEWICRMMSFGSGARYRRQALERGGLRRGMTVLDVATGTGLMARAAAEVVGDPRRVVGVDPSRPMLRESRRGLGNPLVQSIGEALPFAADCFDYLAMGYGLRHVADLTVAFVEFRRVLKSGGRLALVEISRPASRLGRALLGLYLGKIVPAIAGFCTRSPDARRLMKYFWDTIEGCVPRSVILDALRRAGFRQVEHRSVFGIFAEFVAVK